VTAAVTTETVHALAIERDLLVTMATLAAEQQDVDSDDWTSLAADIRGIAPDAADELATETGLVAAACRIRTLLLRRGRRLEEAAERSPDLSLARVLPGGDALRYSYERNLPTETIERKIASRAATLPQGWERRTVAFSSGMAAITNVLHSIAYLLAPTEARPLRIGFWGDYFETDLALEYVSSTIVRPCKLGPDELARAWDGTRTLDVVLIEPTRYNWTLDAVDASALVNGWRRGPGRVPVIVLDTTLTSPAWPTAAVLDALVTSGGAPLVIEVRSGLKLDQQGLELANLGIVEIFQHERSINPELTASRVEEVCRLARGTAGTSLPLASSAALDAPFILNERWTRLHSGRMFQHNAWFAERLAEEGADRGLFSAIAHPALGSGGSRAVSPFTVLHLREDGLDNHGMLLAVIRHEVARRGLHAVHGSSFGFRTTRFETIVPRKSRGAGLFKVAAGARGGPSLNRFTDLLTEIGRFPSMAALRDAYDVTPVRLA